MIKYHDTPSSAIGDHWTLYNKHPFLISGYGVDVNEDEAIFWLKYELKFKLTTDNLRLA